MIQKRSYKVNPNNKPGPKPNVSSPKTTAICYVTEATHAAFEQVAKRRGLTKTQAFEEALTLWANQF